MTLANYITSRLEQPFVWGQNDCILFTIGWLEIKTGNDYLSQYKPWKTAKEALRIVQRIGGLEKVFDQSLTRLNPNMAKDGDITLIGRTAFIFSGNHIVSVGINGLVFLNRMEAKCGWSAY